jgi:hypothetical protein
LTRLALVLAAFDATDREAALVRALSSLPHVDRITIFLVRGSPSIAQRAEQLLSVLERRVARTTVAPAQFASAENVEVRKCSLAELSHELDGVADTVIFLIDAPPPPSSADVLQLWFDGRPSEGLGLFRAARSPARDVVVTRRRGGDSEPHVVQRSVLTVTRGAEAADRGNAAARSTTLLLRALRDVAPTGERWAQSPAEDGGVRIVRIVRALAAAANVIATGVRRRLLRFVFIPGWWHLAYRTRSETFVASSPVLRAGGFREVDCGTDRFWADPVAISVNGVDAVFFEECLYAEGRGVISCAIVDRDGSLGAAQRVLEKPYHLSYPFVFEHAGNVFMIPESAANRTVDLYRCTSFPFDWQWEATLLADIYATDATLHHDGRRWWMFMTVAEHGSYAWDELHIHFADAPQGPWQPHPRNPVKTDARTARPAGPLFMRDGRLIRPAQDCSVSYGGAINLCEVEVLTTTDFREHVVGCIPPDWVRGSDGLHAITSTDRIEVIDVRKPARLRWSAPRRARR